MIYYRAELTKLNNEMKSLEHEKKEVEIQLKSSCDEKLCKDRDILTMT